MKRDKALQIPFLSLGLLSGTALAYEIILMKLFSIIQFHHLAFLVISLALLGYGISGTLLALFRKVFHKHFSLAYLLNILLFAFTALIDFIIAEHIQFNPEELLWEREALLGIFGYFLLFVLPFLFAANATGLALSRGRRIPRLYAADMMGAGIGTLVLLTLLYLLHPFSILQWIATVGLIAAYIASWEFSLSRFWKFQLLLIILLPWLLPNSWRTLSISPYKGLSQTLQIKDTRIIEELSSPLGLLTVVKSPSVPLRYAPGLSLECPFEPPEQLALFTDGDNMNAITYFPEKVEELAYLDYLTSALPYHLNPLQKILIIGAGGGADLLQALYHKIPSIHAVEYNPMVVKIVDRDFGEFSGHLYSREEIHPHLLDGRGFLTLSSEQYDLINLSLMDAFGGSASGLYALSENYLYTIEAFRLYLMHLSKQGYLSITRWVKLPPRDAPKLFITALTALKTLQIAEPGKHLVMIRGWQTTTLIVKRGTFSQREITALKKFSKERSFDLVYYPGIEPKETNHYNLLAKPFFYEVIMKLLSSERERFIAHYPFDIKPTTDNQPYFNHFLKIENIGDIYKLRGAGSLYLMEWGYLIILATLLFTLIGGFLMILLPLFFQHRRELKTPISLLKLVIYFFTLGIAFMFLEIAFMHRFSLYLSHPIFAASITLSAFLLFAGAGSAFSGYAVSRFGSAGTLRFAVMGIFILGIIYLLFLDILFHRTITLPFYIKATITLFLVAPMAFLMGFPFPTGLGALDHKAASLIPWAWGINGYASVLGATLATWIAIHWGFSSVIAAGLIIYLVALVSFAKKMRK
ncbi:MAG: hypothetical protein B6D59_04820 [Campylobacteraceae bacterium 4484_4]|nr:MAG: hypothetical protein B6D59_04820 [Campylobacteraceae bacterium 4484_4]